MTDIDKNTREELHRQLDQELDELEKMKNPKERGTFLKDLAGAIDVMSVGSLFLVALTFVKFLGLEGALILGIFCLVSGIGHFWGVRLCDLPYRKMRFMSSLGGRMELIYKFFSRWHEAFCSISRPIWVLGSSLLAFLVYLITGNLTCFMYAWISFAIETIEVLPLVSELDGATVVKSIAFSVSRRLGLAFMGINVFLLPILLAIGMYMKDAGHIDYAVIIPLLIAGLQGFSEEYYRKSKLEPMNNKQMKIMGAMYGSILVSYLVMPKLFGISSVSITSFPMFWPTVAVGAVGLAATSVIGSNIRAFIDFKKGFFGEPEIS